MDEDGSVNIELFSCSGGMAEGFRRAGVTFDFVFDYDPDACASYAANLRHFPVRMDVRDLVRMTRGGWSLGRIDLLVADPPCTPWSRAGKRLGVEDERDMLEETAELIRLLRPRAYLIGNVPGLQDSTSWHVVQRVIGGLSRHGYCVADYAQLDAADYGVPQHRIRPFWYGHLDGPCVRWPAPTHQDPAHPSLPGMELAPWVTCRAALSHLPVEELGRLVRLKRHDPKHPAYAPDEPGTTVRSGGNGNAAPHVVLMNDRHAPAQPDAPAGTIGAKYRGQNEVLSVTSLDRMGPGVEPHRAVTAAGRGAHPSMEWPWNRPSTTVCAGIDKIAPAAEHAAQFGPNAIILSERAAAILQGFPPGWTFHGKTKKARWAQIGMAMPPPLAEAVARSVKAAMDTPNPLAAAAGAKSRRKSGSR